MRRDRSKRLWIATLSVLALLAPAAPGWAQVEEEWLARFDSGYFAHLALDIAHLPGQGVAVTGYGADSVRVDWFTVRYDENGDELWVDSFDAAGMEDVGRFVAFDRLGNLYVAGDSTTPSSGSDYVVVKHDRDGNRLWVARWDAAGFDDYVTALSVDAQGNAYVTGYAKVSSTDYDYGTLKYDADGNLLWTALYDGPEDAPGDWEGGFALAVSRQGNVYVTGESYYAGHDADYLTVKYDRDGNELWAARYAGPGNEEDYSNAIAVDDLGNVFVGGESVGLGTKRDWAIVKYDSTGVEQWVVRHDAAGESDTATAFALTRSGEVVATGYEKRGSNLDMLTAKYDADGNLLWRQSYDGPAAFSDQAFDIELDAGGNAYVTGISAPIWGCFDYATLKYGPGGDELWLARYDSTDGPLCQHDFGRAIAVARSGSVFVTGWSAGDYLTIKYRQTGPR